jgi:chemotaxis protein MotB
MPRNNSSWEEEDLVPPLAPDETWLTSYGDLMTILLVFFVLLISASQVSSIEFEKIKNAFKAPDPDEQSISKIYDALMERIEVHHLSDVVRVEEDDKTIAITLPGQMLFDLGESRLKGETLPVLSEIAAVLSELPTYARVAIEGHTDDNPVGDKVYTSNWHLSALRAVAVLEHLDLSGGCHGKCEVRGFGEYKPKLENRNPDGIVLPENQQQNRRVVIRVF